MKSAPPRHDIAPGTQSWRWRLVQLLAWLALLGAVAGTGALLMFSFDRTDDIVRSIRASAGLERESRARPPAAPTQSPPRMTSDGDLVTNPYWLTRPDGEELGQLFPQEALMNGISGRVVLECKVTISGWLESCFAVSEEPSGHGFAAASIAAASSYRMQPRTLNGLPVEGGRVRIPLRWATEPPLEPSRWPWHRPETTDQAPAPKP